MGMLLGHQCGAFKKGAKVRYIKGWNSYLGFNRVYTIEQVDVYSYHTDIFLEGFGDIAFNSVDLEVVEE